MDYADSQEFRHTFLEAFISQIGIAFSGMAIENAFFHHLEPVRTIAKREKILAAFGFCELENAPLGNSCHTEVGSHDAGDRRLWAGYNAWDGVISFEPEHLKRQITEL